MYKKAKILHSSVLFFKLYVLNLSEIDKGMYSYSTLQLLYILFHMYIKCSRIDNNIHGFLKKSIVPFMGMVQH